MTLGPVTPIPIMWQNSLVDVQPTSQYGRDFDRAVIMTYLLLQVASDQDVDFLLPSIESPESVPAMRLVNEEAESTQEFEEATAEEAEAVLGPAVQANERAVANWEAVKSQTREWRRTKVRLRSGEQLVRFTSREKIHPTDGVFELKVLAPQAAFVLQTGGSISFAVALPRIPGRDIAIDQAVAENPPGTLLADISERPALAQRKFVAHFWQNDPLYRVKYRYP